ncbi:aminodeoxychorismate synthase, component I [Mesobacillus foraminis]|uniref:Para-aminobenzoate synthetase component 1 n=1 Tax=Mesobacillus foraminis TaxID=279826 RepID=A0A4R2ATU8_9BACI|nr:aminodeoxychorismate synthase, component I [Mesobacillus foraminis]TCN17308.1 para-aminobenzoate synthetase component 1 [Mesobacillus foraminis]
MPNYGIYHQKIRFDHGRFFNRYNQIAEEYKEHVLLESGRGGRYSIAAFDPAASFIGKNNELEINDHTGKRTVSGNPLEIMRDWMGQFRVQEGPFLPDFRGGAIGYISYDYARYIERLPNMSAEDLGTPEVHFFMFNEWFVFDHETECLWVMVLHENGKEAVAEENANQWLEKWKAAGVEPGSKKVKRKESTLEVSMSEEEFIQAVKRIQEYISQGDVFQVNLSVRQTRPVFVPAKSIYQKLRELNPSPYMAYFHTDEYQLVGGSPELLVKIKNSEVSTRPIAGTRSRGKDMEEDEKLAAELIDNEKERAEHVMLVDLERNDLGKVCRYGTVEVDEFMVIEKYSHVMHIVSNVRGELREGEDWKDVIHAVFPGGTITGAPKVRTMEIIEELEPVRRGPYTGSLGWIGFNGDMDMNIMIRTMLVKDGQAHVQAGAGIVIDSSPENEYKESLKKAFALWRAKELAEMEDDSE